MVNSCANRVAASSEGTMSQLDACGRLALGPLRPQPADCIAPGSDPPSVQAHGASNLKNRQTPHAIGTVSVHSPNWCTASLVTGDHTTGGERSVVACMANPSALSGHESVADPSDRLADRTGRSTSMTSTPLERSPAPGSRGAGLGQRPGLAQEALSRSKRTFDNQSKESSTGRRQSPACNRHG